MTSKESKLPTLGRLNPDQRKAVRYGIKNGVSTLHRPLLIVAGPGSGKTRTIADRTINLIAGGATPEEMFIACFTQKAAQELEARIGKTIEAAHGGRSLRFPFAGTFHSIAHTLLREFGHLVGLRKNFTILNRDDATDLMDLVRTRSRQVGKRKSFPQKEICSAILSYQRNTCLSLEATLHRRYSDLARYRKPLQKLFKEYTAAKGYQNVVDFDDLLAFLVDLLRLPEVGARLRRRFKYVLIDEFQDTNRLQLKILKLLKPDGKGVTVVGDDAQAIYSFRGATVENIRDFPDTFERPAKVISLARNYRSTEPILKASNAIMALAANAFEKKLWSKRKSGQRPTLTTVIDEVQQAHHVVRTVLYHRDRNIPLAEQAVLFRASQHSAALELELHRAKIPFQKWGGSKFLEAAHIRDMIAILKWSQNPRDQIAGFRVLNLLDWIGKATANRLVQDVGGAEFLTRLSRATPPAGIADQWRSLVKLFNRLAKAGWPASLDAAVHWYRPFVDRLYGERLESRRADLHELVALADNFASRRQFLAELALDQPGILADQKSAKESSEDLLTLSTIHSAKGCEWKSVTILSVIDGCIPLINCRTDEEMEEERRLLFVAMTRAKDHLDLVLPRRHFQPFSRSPAATLSFRRSKFLPNRLFHLFDHRTARINTAENKLETSTRSCNGPQWRAYC